VIRLSRAVAAGIIAGCMLAAAAHAGTADEIQHLLDYVSGSGCTFVRNGVESDAVAAEAHSDQVRVCQRPRGLGRRFHSLGGFSKQHDRRAVRRALRELTVPQRGLAHGRARPLSGMPVGDTGGSTDCRREKHILHTASVIGEKLSERILRRVAQLSLPVCDQSLGATLHLGFRALLTRLLSRLLARSF
jgi:hypothetical protein